MENKFLNTLKLNYNLGRDGKEKSFTIMSFAITDFIYKEFTILSFHLRLEKRVNLDKFIVFKINYYVNEKYEKIYYHMRAFAYERTSVAIRIYMKQQLRHLHHKLKGHRK
uniref:Uncharacterized protein n=1 Tax=Glossina palpalis gambiensis TaxID=67801 RepID=A0A1B0AN37_9MUSC